MSTSINTPARTGVNTESLPTGMTTEEAYAALANPSESFAPMDLTPADRGW